MVSTYRSTNYSKIGAKMIYASSKDTLKKKCPGLIELDVGDEGELDYSSLADEVQCRS